MENNNITMGGWTPDELAKMKSRYGRLFLVAVEAENEDQQELFFWFKHPDMKVISAFTKVSQADPISGMQVLFKNCLISAGMEKYADDPEVFLAVSEQLGDLVKKRKASSQSF